MTTNVDLARNLLRRFQDAGVYKRLAQRPGISTRAKSGYYRAAIMLLATAAEGMLLYLIRKHTNDLNPVVGSFQEKKSLQPIDPRHIGGTTDIFLATHVRKNIKLMGRECTFKVMNKYALDEGLVSQKEFEKLEKVRNLRKKFHVFTIDGNDTGYTLPVLNSTETVVDFLAHKVLKLLIAAGALPATP